MTDNRIALQPSQKLLFPSMTVTIEEEIGRGSNSIVYRGTYPDLQSQTPHHVLIKELFPLHPDGLFFRNENGLIDITADFDFASFHRASFLTGNQVHLELLKNDPDGVGGNINTFMYNRTLYTVLNYNGGRSLQNELESNTHTLEQVVKVIQSILLCLKDFHKCGFLHLDIAPDNIMLLGTEERQRVMLIDYNSTMSKYDLQPRFSIKQGYSAPELQNGEISLFSESSDLYSIAAVFLRWIRGYALMPFETVQRMPPAISDCLMLQDVPQPVMSMIKQILFKGLAVNPKRRYKNSDEMLADFRELEDRIHGIGVTHWALWEAGKRTVSRLIKTNTALRYLEREDELFPIHAQSDDGTRSPIGEHIDALMNGHGHLFITAPGGMGKTTSMLHALKAHSVRYSPHTPAIIYIPLHGKNTTSSHDITDKILEHLQFKADIKNYEEARHALHQLLSNPLKKGDATYPSAVLFLDGLNEVTEGLESVLEEITVLSKLGGVQIFITSRTVYPLEGFLYHTLSPLTPEEEQTILSSHHLLLPSSHDMQELLRTPLMLSMFIELSRQSGMQPSAKTPQELMDAYLASLIQKEIAHLSEDSPLRLKIDVAVHLVLPRIAARLCKTGIPANDAVLLKETTACYKLIRSPLLIKAFPQWIGYKKTILDQDESCDDWYNTIVHELLWRRLGLLIKDEQGNYILIHRIIGDYLSSLNKTANTRIARYRTIKYGLLTALCALLAAGVVFAYIHYPKPIAEEPPTPYQTELSVQILSNGVMAYNQAGYPYEYARKVVDAALDESQEFANAYHMYGSMMSTLFPAGKSPLNEGKETLVNHLLQSGDAFLWTEQPLQKEEYLALFDFSQEKVSEYESILGALNYMMNDPCIKETYGTEYLTMVSELLELDADITATLYAISCRPQINAMIDAFFASDDATDVLAAQNLSTALTANPNQNAHLPKQESLTALNDSLKSLMGQRENLYYEIKSHGAYILYRSKAQT